MRSRDAGSCEIGAFTMNGVVKLLSERIVDDANERFELVSEGEGDGDVGMSVDEIGGSVYRVDDKGWGGSKAARFGSFFAKEAVGRVRNFVTECLIRQCLKRETYE